MILTPTLNKEFLDWLVQTTAQLKKDQQNSGAYLIYELITRKVELMDRLNNGWKEYGPNTKYEPIYFFRHEALALASLSNVGYLSDNLTYALRAEAEFNRLKDGMVELIPSLLTNEDYAFIRLVAELEEQNTEAEFIRPLSDVMKMFGNISLTSKKTSSGKAILMQDYFKLFEVITPGRPLKDTVLTANDFNNFLIYLRYLEKKGYFKKKFMGGYRHEKIREKVQQECERRKRLEGLLAKLPGYIEEKRMISYDDEQGEILAIALMTIEKKSLPGTGLVGEFKERLAQGIRSYPHFQPSYEGWAFIDERMCELLITGLTEMYKSQDNRGLSPHQVSKTKDKILLIISNLKEIEF